MVFQNNNAMEGNKIERNMLLIEGVGPAPSSPARGTK
jgi:hypothetical protein